MSFEESAFLLWRPALNCLTQGTSVSQVRVVDLARAGLARRLLYFYCAPPQLSDLRAELLKAS